jgi:hypothetical protein
LGILTISWASSNVSSSLACQNFCYAILPAQSAASAERRHGTFHHVRHEIALNLPPLAREIVLSACWDDHRRKYELYVVVVMPDHVHLILTPSSTSKDVKLIL